jgi:hypothetical protein
MCLDAIENTFNPPQAGVKRGWKIFLNDAKDGEATKLKSPWLNFLFPENVWIEDQHTHALNATYGIFQYQTGFHIFANKEDVETLLRGVSRTYHLIKEVEYDDVVATGTQKFMDAPCQVVVARKIKIIGGS